MKWRRILLLMMAGLAACLRAAKTEAVPKAVLKTVAQISAPQRECPELALPGKSSILPSQTASKADDKDPLLAAIDAPVGDPAQETWQEDDGSECLPLEGWSDTNLDAYLPDPPGHAH